MKNVTLSADEHLIERARQVARSRHKTLNAAFREWLQEFVSRSEPVLEYDEVMRRLSHVNAGRKFSRDEMNERR
jgi:predicted transcriptional regulator